MFQQICSIENIKEAYRKTRLGKGKHKISAIDFERSESRNLRQLQKELKKGTYRPRAYHRFYVFEPKRRLIQAPSYRDKIVQHAINNVLHPVLSKRFIKDSYACIVNKGHGRALNQVQNYLQQAHREYGENNYLVKVDIAKFFYTIDHDVTIKILRKHIQCKKTLKLLKVIIRSCPDPKGLPLGNLISQLLANLYLNELDQWAKRKLGVKYYLRYADDILAITKDKESARYIKGRICNYLKKRLNLKPHPRKTRIQPSFIGLDSLGFKVYREKILLNSQAKKRSRRLIRKVLKTKQLKANSISTLNSWLSHVVKSQCLGFLKQVAREFKSLRFYTKNKLPLPLRLRLKIEI